MTPREASMLEGQILDPGDWPWQDDEAKMTALEAKTRLKDAVLGVSARELDASVATLLQVTRLNEEAERKEKEPAPIEEVLEDDVAGGSPPQPPPPPDPSPEDRSSRAFLFSINRRRNAPNG